MYEGSIASVTPTVCGLFRVNSPELCTEAIPSSLDEYNKRILGDAAVDRCLIYCPDALGDQIWSKHPNHAESISTCAPQRVRLSSVMPPKTPVCFASIFTGAQPVQHGIRKYERPVLTCDTLFDAMIRAGKKVAIVAVRSCSVDIIFRNRPIDYYSENYDEEVTERTLTLLSANRHELVVVYHQEYDDLLHQTNPHSDQCIVAAENHITSFRTLCEAAHLSWAEYYRAIVFAPDHGGHINPETGKGDHGIDTPEDIAVSHWYGIFRPGTTLAEP